MEEFRGKLAVITGGSSGIGRELAIQLAKEGCHLALCATSAEKLAETERLCKLKSANNVRISTHIVDVSEEAQVLDFCEVVCREHSADHIDLLINNAGITGSDSFVTAPRNQWEKIFNINWFGVYYCTRTFLPLLMEAEESHIVNISSVTGLWALQGAYSTSKFAVRGFTEALVSDLRQNAPNVKASVVFPGRVSTDLIAGSQKHLGQMTEEEAQKVSKAFSDSGITTAMEAATIILEGVRKKQWRILVGVDAVQLDHQVRLDPDYIYEPDFASRVEAWRE